MLEAKMAKKISVKDCMHIAVDVLDIQARESVRDMVKLVQSGMDGVST
jgi:hypothetical protein